MTVTDDLFERVRDLSDEDWLAAHIRAIEGDDGIPGMPRVPELAVQRLSNATSDSAGNIRTGFTFYRLVKHYLDILDRPLMPESRVLDFGCGWGRVARFFLKDVKGEGLFGIDPAPRAIEAVQATMPYGTFRVSEVWPPSGLEPESFDLIYALSVFSHLPEDLHRAWIAELAALLRRDGVLVATTLSRRFVESASRLRTEGELDLPWQRAAAASFLDPDAAVAEYDAGHFLFAPNPRADYGMAVAPRSWVEQMWSPYLTLHAFADDPSVLQQAVMVASKARRA